MPDPKVGERRERVLHLRTQGYTYEHIARVEGITPAQAVSDARVALAGRSAERKREDDALSLELERLDGLEREVRDAMKNGDPRLVLQGVEQLNRISGRRASLLRLDRPAVREGEAAPSGLDEIARKRAERRRAAGW